jgi:hypothetical protein
VKIRLSKIRPARGVSPASIIVVTLALLAGGAGIADAATGGAFLLGRSNTETSTATLSSSRGTPLSLSAPKNKAPLAVNRNVMVRNLNAQYVGGLSASALESTGGSGVDTDSVSIPADAYSLVATTKPLAAGTYYVTATAEVNVEAGNSGALCLLTVNNDTDAPLQVGAETGNSFVQTAETVGVTVRAKDTLEEWCSVQGTGNASQLRTAAITAIRVLSSSSVVVEPVVSHAGTR